MANLLKVEPRTKFGRLNNNRLHRDGKLPAVLYGPGDVRVAHAVNERIRIDEIVDAVAVLATFISTWAA